MMTFLHLNIYAWVPFTTSFGSVSTFKHDDLPVLKYLSMGPLHDITMLGSVSTFKQDYLSALKPLCMDSPTNLKKCQKIL